MFTNEFFWLIFLVIDLSCAILVYRLFGRDGLYALIVVEIIISNIQVIKLIELFGITTTLGNIAYASIFFATDVLSEVYGKDAARKGVWLGFTASVISLIFMSFALLFKPAEGDIAHPHLRAIFSWYPRILLASWTAYLLSQNHDVWAFHMWKKKTKGRLLWLRNNASTMVSQLIDSVVFVTIAFAGVYSIGIFLQILVTTYLLKLIIAAFDTPFIYWAVFWKRKEKEVLVT